MENIFITGVSTGIGYATTEYFLSLGYRVFGSVRKTEDLERLNKRFSKFFPHLFVGLLFDVTDEHQVFNAVEKTTKILGDETLSALVNNAGFAQSGPMALLSDQVFRQQIEVNLFGVRTVTDALLPLLGTSKKHKGPPGKIINISSVSGIFNTPMNGAYCVSKHALESLGEIYRRELSMYGIKVVSIQPGPIQSALWNKNANAFEEYNETDYVQMAKKSDVILKDAIKNALPALVIAKLIDKIILSQHPRRSYIVIKNVFLVTVFAKYMPAFIVDYFFHGFFYGFLKNKKTVKA